MFSTDFIFRQQDVDNQKCQAGFRPLCNKILFLYFTWKSIWLEGSFSESGDWFSSESGEFESSEGSAAIEGLLEKINKICSINILGTIRIQIGEKIGIYKPTGKVKNGILLPKLF